ADPSQCCPPGRARVPSRSSEGEEPAITSLAGPAAPRITVGVDTHLDVHVAHANDQLGRRVDTLSIPTTPTGYQDLLAWARRLGEPVAWGVEGTGSYGAALARFPYRPRPSCLGVNRPDRQARRRHGKSDPLDAEAAARAVHAGQATVAPKTGPGQGEMTRPLRVARQTAIRARTQAINATRRCWSPPRSSCASNSAACQPPCLSPPQAPPSQGRSPARSPRRRWHCG